jgi:hypothetical protein
LVRLAYNKVKIKKSTVPAKQTRTIIIETGGGEITFSLTSTMPYYRIIVWTKKRKEPYAGIRLIGDDNINAVYNEYQSQAKRTYKNDYIDVEVQMLSKLCTAVKDHIKKAEP